jgi:Holliday junction resolvasome RuvABC endonuclease subunit
MDMATHTGWAIVDTDTSSVGSGALIYRNGKRDIPLATRLCRFRGDLFALISTNAIGAVIYEVAHHRGGPATRSGLGMETVLIMECYAAGIPCFGVHSGTLKKFAAGYGKAEKSDMMLAASRMACRKITDDNEADAVCLAKWGVMNVERDSNGQLAIIEKPVTTKSKRRTK